MNKLIKTSIMAATAALVLTSGAALAIEKAANLAAAKAAADKRGILFEDMGDLMDKKLGPMVRSPSAFDAAVAKTTATQMATLANQIPAAFAVDTRGFRVMTRARDEIWQKHPDFLTKQKALTTSLANLQKVAGGGDRKAVSQAIVQLGQTCKNCHTSYKTD